jgi:hypothetical protein
MKSIRLIFAVMALGSISINLKSAINFEAPVPIEESFGEVTATDLEGVYLSPFKDFRSSKLVHSGNMKYEQIRIIPQAITILAQEWRDLSQGDLSVFLHRQLINSLRRENIRLLAAEFPGQEENIFENFKEKQISFLIRGKILGFSIRKRGADIIGTNFSGTRYEFKSLVELELVSLENGQTLVKEKIDFNKNFFSKKMLGERDRDTFPRYFSKVLPLWADAIVRKEEFRKALGLGEFKESPASEEAEEEKLVKKKDKKRRNKKQMKRIRKMLK